MGVRTSAIIDDDIFKKLIELQGKLIQENQKSCSYSCAINYSLRQYFMKN